MTATCDIRAARQVGGTHQGEFREKARSWARASRPENRLARAARTGGASLVGRYVARIAVVLLPMPALIGMRDGLVGPALAASGVYIAAGVAAWHLWEGPDA
jgi:hypothetical protein